MTDKSEQMAPGRGVKAALVCALLGALGLHFYLDQYERQVRGGELISVLTLVRDVQPGEILSADDLQERELPERYLDERHIPLADLDRVVGNPVQVVVGAGDALLWTDIGVSEMAMQLSELVSVGRRAVRIPGRDVSFGGLLHPGDRVDVLLTEGSEGLLSAASSRTRALLENVLVLAVGGRVSRDDVAAAQGGAVTLSVTPAQALRFESHRRKGQLSLALRNPDDIALAQTTPSGEVPDAR